MNATNTANATLTAYFAYQKPSQRYDFVDGVYMGMKWVGATNYANPDGRNKFYSDHNGNRAG